MHVLPCTQYPDQSSVTPWLNTVFTVKTPAANKHSKFKREIEGEMASGNQDHINREWNLYVIKGIFG